MAISVYFNPPAMTAAMYDEAVKRIEDRGQGHPAGRLYHCTFGSDDKLQLFDIWESQEAFDTFAGTYVPVAEELGLEMGQPMVEQVHSIIIPA